MSVLHPTILIGYGRYGRSVLRRLLTSASSRGVLVWEDPAGGEGPSARRLKDLALLCVAEEPANDGELDHDLSRQIHDVWPRGQRGDHPEPNRYVRAALVEAMLTSKNRLLDAAARSGDRERLRLGLDVIVIAQPSGVQILGALEDLLQPAMDAVANDPNLRAPAQGQDLLNFIQMLDFDHYWDRSQAGRILRHEAVAAVRRWQDRLRAGKPSFGRIYVTDAYTPEGYRDVDRRIDETTLFLEFLLFEGQREQEILRRSYQRERDGAPVLATFGIRVIERSRGLLSRLAAARFASGWLEYLAGSQPAHSDAARQRLCSGLRAYRPDAFDLASPRAELLTLLSQGLRRIEDELLELPIDEDWAQRVRSEAARAALRLKSDLTNWAGERTQRLTEEKLAGLSVALEQVITSSLQDSSTPAPLGSVIDELKSLQSDLETFDPLTPRPRSEVHDSFARVEDIQRRLDHFRLSQVNPAALKEWWLLLGLALAAAWTPAVLEAIEEVSPPDVSAAFVVHAGFKALTWMAQPAVVLPLILASAWIVGQQLMQPGIRKRVLRGVSAFVHRERGRVADRIRVALSSGQFKTSLELHAETVFHDMIVRLRSEIQREITRALARLTARQRELDWLRIRLRDFQRSNGLDPDQPVPAFDAHRNDHAYCRYSIEHDRDLNRILAFNPATIERFESTQATRKPFVGWMEQYCDAFLYPLNFLEDLSREYQERPGQQLVSAEGERTARATEFCQFLDNFGRFPPAMQWSSTEGDSAVETESFCIIPDIWKGLPNVLPNLKAIGFTDRRILPGEDPDRTYLLRAQFGLEIERLKDSESS